MAKRRTTREQDRAQKKHLKKIAMDAPGGKSRYCDRPVDPNRSVVNTPALARYRRWMARAWVETDLAGNAINIPVWTPPAFIGDAVRTLAVIALVFLGACSSEDRTVEALTKAGYTDVKPMGWSPFSCSDDDTFSTGFTALNPAGARVEGVACCNIVFKGCTLRF